MRDIFCNWQEYCQLRERQVRLADRALKRGQHWDGRAWTIVPGPELGDGGSLQGVTTASADSARAVGGAVRLSQGLTNTGSLPRKLLRYSAQNRVIGA